MPALKNYFDIRNVSSSSADIYIYSPISRWGEEYGYKSAKDVQAELKAIENVSQLNVYINSPGGAVFEGTAIKSMLSRLNCKKTVYIDGLCASIATVIAFGIGAEVHMSASSLVMIHNALNQVYGNCMDFEKAAEDLKKVDNTLVAVYKNRCGDTLSEEEIRAFMADETWFSADECMSYGFIDVIDEVGTQQACLPKDFYDRYKNVPSAVLMTEVNNNDKSEMTAEEKAVLDNAEKVLAEYEKRKDDDYARYYRS